VPQPATQPAPREGTVCGLTERDLENQGGGHPRHGAWRIALICLGLGALMGTGAVWQVSLRRPAGPAEGTCLHGGPPAERTTRKTLRVATYNIRRGLGSNGKRSLDRIATQLRGFDLIGLNEVEGPVFWRPDQTELLGRRTGLMWLFAPTERRWGWEHFGNGILSGLPVRGWRRVPLPNATGISYRNMLLARVDCSGVEVHLLITHVDLRRDRRAQLRRVAETFRSLPEPAILLGDLNASADDPQVRALVNAPGVADPVAEIGWVGRRSDWVLTRGLRTVAAGVNPSDASDHPLVWAELEVPPGNTGR